MNRNIRELWKYRALVWALLCRHLSARYRGSVLGFVWSFLNPLCLIAVYSLVFRFYIRFDDVENYTLFLFTGLLPWIWFSSGLLEATSAISSGGSLITKAMFPAHVLPIVAVLTNLMHFLFAIPILLGFMLVVGVNMSPSLISLPLVIAVELVFIAGLSLLLSALNVYYRDIQHILGNVMTLLFFLCPILYPVENIPAKFRFTIYLNPLALFTRMYHEIFLEGVFPAWNLLALVASIALLTFLMGNLVFNRYREGFAELV
ncbi:MAG: ABC transporter permease [Deltaproteobacteria bacterium]|nr:ABC transporter permease [Deltaproteobacteria bacterium]